MDKRLHCWATMKKFWILALASSLSIGFLKPEIGRSQTLSTVGGVAGLALIVYGIIKHRQNTLPYNYGLSSTGSDSSPAGFSSGSGSSGTSTLSVAKQIYLNNLRDEAALFLTQPHAELPHTLQKTFEQIRRVAAVQWGLENPVTQMNDQELAASLIRDVALMESQKRSER